MIPRDYSFSRDVPIYSPEKKASVHDTSLASANRNHDEKNNLKAEIYLFAKT